SSRTRRSPTRSAPTASPRCTAPASRAASRPPTCCWPAARTARRSRARASPRSGRSARPPSAATSPARGRCSRPAPTRTARAGEGLALRIDSLAFGGRGVARHDGVVVFVGGALPGDRVRARITKVRRRHAEGVAVERIELGPDRVDAPCPHFGPCGGCRWQDLLYKRQLEHKATQVDDALRRIGHLQDY